MLALWSVAVSLVFVAIYTVAPGLAEALTILFVAAIVIPAIIDLRDHGGAP